ncbi:cytochrome C biogenesis protein [Methanocella sp. CWC-04]|uniref:Cytochrome C biogenesis protein n=1 Tax=Methanooceanicella nereidis TaxID=2052831 RepID=A0AAP2W598_9EURY|nr:aromatic aminobenezylarsenical efflux permease ArsG family transporter [Methanocella sp. CWC-04]MCD1293952.1 cytochrome C biogenesis protein [Methanocella sp. CWC-04]
MDSLIVGSMAALWLGILTSISPCPLATNIAAISFIGKRIENVRHVIYSGILYTLGRSVVYVILGALLVASVLSIQEVAVFLQKYMNELLGPILIITGMMLLEMIKFEFRGTGISQKALQKVKSDNVWSSGLLGIIFAMAFCPVSAALFFGGLIPLSVRDGSNTLYPALYGIGTALPVVFFALLIAFSARSVSKAFNKITKIETKARRITGILFIAVGLYYSLRYIFGIF